MKTILYMASTLNGHITTVTGDTNWTSKEDWQGFLAMTKKVGNAIIGRHTYDVITREHTQFKSLLTIVLTKNKTLIKTTPITIITNKSPRKVLNLIKQKGFKTALVCGGGILNSSFLKEDLIDEIYLDIEPLILGKGIPLIEPEDLTKRLRLLSVKKLNQNTIQLHYQVIKK